MINETKLQEEMEKDAAAGEADDTQEVTETQEGSEEAAEDDATGAEEDAGEADEDADEPEAASAEDDEDADEEPAPTAPIPVKAFLKQKAKWKTRMAEAKKQMQELASKSQAQGGLSAEDALAYKQYKGYVGKLQEAAQRYPWLMQQLAALEQGHEPDWRAVHQALDAHVKALPALDPTTQAMLAQQGKIVQELQHQANRQRFAERKTSEDSQIRQLYKEAADPLFFKTLNEITGALVEALPEGAFQVPDRVSLAKKLMVLRKREREALLKEQVEKSKVKKNAGTPQLKGGGGAPKAKKAIPAFGTPEFEQYMAESVEEYAKG